MIIFVNYYLVPKKTKYIYAVWQRSSLIRNHLWIKRRRIPPPPPERRCDSVITAVRAFGLNKYINKVLHFLCEKEHYFGAAERHMIAIKNNNRSQSNQNKKTKPLQTSFFHNFKVVKVCGQRNKLNHRTSLAFGWNISKEGNNCNAINPRRAFNDVNKHEQEPPSSALQPSSLHLRNLEFWSRLAAERRPRRTWVLYELRQLTKTREFFKTIYHKYIYF